MDQPQAQEAMQVPMKDNISCRVTFFVIVSSSWSLIFCVSYSRSLGAMDKDVPKILGAGPKYCLIVTPAPAACTQQGVMVVQWQQSVHPDVHGLQSYPVQISLLGNPAINKIMKLFMDYYCYNI